MAKKVAKAKSVSKKNNTLLYGLGVLILVVIIVILVRSGKQQAGPATIDVTGQEPSEQQNPVTEGKLEGVKEELKCDVGAAIGFKSCAKLATGDVEMIVYHSCPAAVELKKQLTGAQYYMYDENGEKVAEASQMGTVECGQEAKYTLPFSQYPDANKIEIRPVVNVDGADKICVNQRVVVTPSTSCIQ